MMLQAILEPIIVRLEANKHAGWFAVARNHDFFGGGQTKIVREVIFDFGERHFTAVFGRARQARLRLPLS